MTRTGQDAIDYARSRIGPDAMSDSSLCLAFTRECFAVPAYYGSAIDAWNGCVNQHPGDRNPPPAVPVWFLSSSIYDHVAFYVSPGEVITTWGADVRALSMASMESNYGPFLGWGEDINTVSIWTPPPPPNGDDMPLSQADLESIERIMAGQIDKRLRLAGEGDETRGAALSPAAEQHLAEVVDRAVAGQLDKRLRPQGDGDETRGVALSDQARQDVRDIVHPAGDAP